MVAYGSSTTGETHFLGAESASSPYQKAINDGFSERFAGGNRFRFIHPLGVKMRVSISRFAAIANIRRASEHERNIVLFL